MRPLPRVASGMALVIPLGMSAGMPIASAQVVPTPLSSRDTRSLPDSSTAQDSSAKQQRAPNLPPKNWPSPVEDKRPNAFLLSDVLEYRPTFKDSGNFRWDVVGWYGGDYNRIWVKSEGEQNTAFKADYDIDAQLLYGRFIKKYYDFQIGVRGETQTFRGENVARAHGVIGFQGLVPYNYEIESALFISQDGDVSARLQGSKDLLLTQRLILQARFETHAAIQKVERFTTGRGLNNIEFGLRLRYEIRREIAPYIGVSIDRSFFGTADLVRQDGGTPHQIRFVAGMRLWY